MSPRLLSEDILKKFHKEVIDHVRESEQLVQALRRNGRDQEAFEQLGRHLHSLKGSAPIMGAKPISAIASELEECVKAVKNSPNGAQDPILEKFSDALQVIRRQIEQFVKKEEMESGADAIEALRSLMPAGKLLEGVLKHLEVHTPELLDVLGETHRDKLKDSLNSLHRVYSIYLSLPRSSFQTKLVEALKMIGAAGTAVAYAHSSKKPREGFDQVMVLLVVSELDGAEFSKRLGTLPVDVLEIVTQAHSLKESQGKGPDAHTPAAIAQGSRRDPAQKPRILLVEDSDATRELYRMVLMTNGFEVETAKDGEEALDRLRKQTFNVVLSDDQMPVMDGMELLRAIKSDSTLQDLPVIIMSGKGTEEDRANALSAGAALYFVKGTFEKPVLVAALKRVAL